MNAEDLIKELQEIIKTRGNLPIAVSTMGPKTNRWAYFITIPEPATCIIISSDKFRN